MQLSQNSASNVFPLLRYSEETSHFLPKFHFQCSNVTDCEYIQLWKIRVENKHCYTTHGKDVGKPSTPFRIRLKPLAKLQTQRVTKVPIEYWNKLNTSLDDLQKKNNKENGSTPHYRPIYGTSFLNPLIFYETMVLVKFSNCVQCWTSHLKH